MWRASSGATVLPSGAEDEDCEDLDAVMRGLGLGGRSVMKGWRDECVSLG